MSHERVILPDRPGSISKGILQGLILFYRIPDEWSVITLDTLDKVGRVRQRKLQLLIFRIYEVGWQRPTPLTFFAILP